MIRTGVFTNFRYPKAFPLIVQLTFVRTSSVHQVIIKEVNLAFLEKPIRLFFRSGGLRKGLRED
jgi:hypothetical protein